MYGGTQSNPGNVLDRNSLSEMNLKVLKRIDPFTEELLASAGHVALYDFQTGEKKWVQKGVEGTLFLIRRHSAPFYRYIVLNKKSQDHYMEDLHNGFKFEAGERYGRMFLLYKNCKSEVVGIWFYDTEECEKVIALLKGIASQHPQPPQPRAEEGSAIPYPLTIGSLPHQSPAQPMDGLGVGVSGMTSPENSFWDRGPVSAPSGGNPLYSADGRTLADAPGLTPRPGNPLHTPAAASNPLERLFGQSARLASTQPPSTQPPIASSIPPLPSGSFGGLPPFRNAEQPQAGAGPLGAKQPAAALPPLPATHTPPNELLYASPQGNKPVQSMPTPFASQPQQTSQMSRASTPQASSLPSLLKPSHFQAAGSARTADQEGAPSLTPPSQTALPPSNPSQTLDQSNAQETFMKLFNAKEKEKPETPLEQHAAAEVEKSLESLVAETPLKDGATEDLLPEKYAKARSSGDSGHRGSTDSGGGKPTPPGGAANRNAALVRSAVRALADSDAFIDILVRELDRSGLLR